VIAERPHRLLGPAVRFILRRKLSRGLSAVRVVGLERLRAESARAPLLLCANHTAFWDGPLLELLSGAASLDLRVLMLAGQLRRAPLLRWAGCFGVEENDPRDGVRALRHGARFLDRPGRALWIFPQGRQRPGWERPLQFRGGAARIAALSKNCAVVPVSIQYELAEREEPEAWVQFGAPLAAPVRTEAIEAAVTRGLDQLRNLISAEIQIGSLLPAHPRLGEGPATRLLARMLPP